MLWLALIHTAAADPDCSRDFVWGGLEAGSTDVPLDLRPWFEPGRDNCEEVELSWRLETYDDAQELWVVTDQAAEALPTDRPMRLGLSGELAADTLFVLTFSTAEREDFVTFTTGAHRVASPVSPPLLAFREPPYIGGWPGEEDVTWIRPLADHDPDASGAGLLRFYEVGVDAPLEVWPANATGAIDQLVIQHSDGGGERCFQVSHEDGAGLAEVWSEPLCADIQDNRRGCSTTGRGPTGVGLWLATLLGLVTRRTR